ncbi:hypothetical protein FISHEDRAFT_43394 [Fistulina hepatica ATCC 64428]|uniref:Carbohydrate kinase PfkB domain-containing protein n=1 Tax=Fistulina hepatica ATCC 64428 TaxID=1128425 RepID=A0A0D7ADJ0_9AGAR|nr:hypothetical protein FISHEDRAFT_43394 [Fistulina hepatica ATCC 64428]
MAKLRRETGESQFPPYVKPLRIVASGTLFITHTLSVASYPLPSTSVRAHSVRKARKGIASVLAVLAQFAGVDAHLVAPLSGNEEGRAVIRELVREGVSTRHSKIWSGLGVPTAWVLRADDGDARAVINHNPLPEISHEDFVMLLGPLLAPENYMQSSPTPSPNTVTHHAPLESSPTSPRPSYSNGQSPSSVASNPNSPAPFDWLHFEGRSAKTTLSNMAGVDGLARERKWRSHCVFSLDVGQKSRQGVEALIPHADVIFLHRNYARATAPQYATTPRAFLLSLSAVVPPHALLVAHWGSDGAAVLSMPTKEYFQSSGWVDNTPVNVMPKKRSASRLASSALSVGGTTTTGDVLSVRSSNDFWAGDRSRSTSSPFTLGESDLTSGSTPWPESSSRMTSHDRDDDSGTEMPAEEGAVDIDEVGGHEAFVAGMIYALSRRILPGPPYTPVDTSPQTVNDKARWKLDECLRFAIELAGRKARRDGWSGLAAEMARAGWFDNVN